MLMALPLVTLMVLMLIVLRTRGDSRRDLRRCPKCWYSMDGNAELRCPECGHQSRAEKELYRPRGNPLVFHCATFAMLVTAAMWWWNGSQLPWTHKVPRFALRIALNIAEPYQGVPASNAEIATRAPKPNDSWASDPWDRALWRKTVDNNLRQWVDAVMSRSGPIRDDELPALVPLAVNASQWYTRTNDGMYSEQWLSEDTKQRTVHLRDIASNPAIRVRAEWALSELQCKGVYSPGSDWSVIPNQVIDMCLRHADPDVRLYGLSRVARAAGFDLITNDGSGVTVDMKLLSQIAEKDPDPRVQQNARDLSGYMKR